MSSYQNQEALDSAVQPIVVNNNNFAKDTPTLLSFDEAETLFHEFGHGLHGLLSRVRYPSQSGTSVRRDFVEFPSQIFEHWMSAPETLRQYARHHATGEPIPEELLRRLIGRPHLQPGLCHGGIRRGPALTRSGVPHPTPRPGDDRTWRALERAVPRPDSP